MSQLMLWMLEHDSQWTLWYYNGHTAVFAWRPEGQPARSLPASADPVQLAFGPEAKRLPRPKAESAIEFPESFDDWPHKRELIDRYFIRRPIPSHDGDVVTRYQLQYLLAESKFQTEVSDMSLFNARRCGEQRGSCAEIARS